MTSRTVSRVVNWVLISGAILIALAVLVDTFEVGPRRAAPPSATLDTRPAPFNPIAPPPEVAAVTTIARKPRSCSATALMPFGGSLTGGTNSYRRLIVSSMNERRIPIDLVGSQSDGERAGGDPDHEGYPGFVIGPSKSSQDTLATAVERALKLRKPDVILLLTGTDDLLRQEDASAMASGLTALVTRIRDRSPGSLVIIAELPPTVKDPIGSPNLKAYNDRAKLLSDADSFDSVFFAPLNTKLAKLGFEPRVDMSADGREFTASGARKFTAAIEPVIAGAIVRDRSRRCVPTAPQRAVSTTTLPLIDNSDFVIP
jgi:lysophospholipase L1-like esterase